MVVSQRCVLDVSSKTCATRLTAQKKSLVRQPPAVWALQYSCSIHCVRKHCRWLFQLPQVRHAVGYKDAEQQCQHSTYAMEPWVSA